MRNLKGLLRFADSMRCERPLGRAAIDRVGILFGIRCSLVATLARCSLAMTCPCVIASEAKQSTVSERLTRLIATLAQWARSQ